MRVILDTTSVANTAQSSYRYFAELIPRFRKHSDVALELIPSPYFDTPAEWKGAAEVHKALLPKGTWLPQGRVRSALSKVKWFIEKQRLQKHLEKTGHDSIYHSFFYTLPPSDDLVFIPNALDLIVEKFGHQFGHNAGLSQVLDQKKKCFDRADRILAISQATKDDLVSFYSIPGSKIDVVHLAANPKIFSTQPTSEDIRNTLTQFKIEKPFLLQVGGRLHHRNFSSLLEAFSLNGLSKNFQLVAAGNAWLPQELELMKRLGIESRVILAENPNDTHLRNLYHAAEMLVYPSLYEGFGFPIVEAMTSGLPVATSLSAGSIPEIAGNAAIYFDPKNPEDIAKKISALASPELKKKMIQLGYENIKRFSWDQTAAKTLESFSRAILSPSN